MKSRPGIFRAPRNLSATQGAASKGFVYPDDDPYDRRNYGHGHEEAAEGEFARTPGNDRQCPGDHREQPMSRVDSDEVWKSVDIQPGNSVFGVRGWEFFGDQARMRGKPPVDRLALEPNAHAAIAGMHLHMPRWHQSQEKTVRPRVAPHPRGDHEQADNAATSREHDSQIAEQPLHGRLVQPLA